MKSRRTWWLLFSAGAALVALALVWITLLVLRLEARAQHEAAVRLALWRMDSWLGPRLGREEMRPYFEYLPFYAQQRAYTRLLNEIEPGEVITPSPLLTFQSDLFPLHFQASAEGEITSPQAPSGNWRDLAEGGADRPYVTHEDIERHEPLLVRVRNLIAPPVQLDRCVDASESLLARMLGEDRTQHDRTTSTALLPMPPVQTMARDGQTRGQTEDMGQSANAPQSPTPQSVQQWAAGAQQKADLSNAISKGDMSKRAQTGYSQKQQQEDQKNAPEKTAQVMIEPQKGAAIVDVESVDVGELVPVWLGAVAEAASDERAGNHSVRAAANPSEEDGGRATQPQPATPTLLYLRRVRIGNAEVYQGVLCDWDVLRASLLEQINDLFPHAVLLPQPRPTPEMMESGQMLGGVPVTLEAPCPAIAAGPLFTAARTTLGLAWLAVIGAIVAAGITLRSSIHFGEKRSRFASAVTHELRTPLTTFRMYSEMLAEGMVREESQRREYLRTLQQESGRLSTLVENVLAYARLEEGRSASHAQRMHVADLLARVRDALQRRADDAGMQLIVRDHTPAETMISVDAEAVGQILFNLVDNACKYAMHAPDKRIEVDVSSPGGERLAMTVRDHGPGISAEHERAIFRAFDRGAHGPGDTIPGVGLGLALARGLARDMAGDLTLERCDDGGTGACFRLILGSRV